MMNKRGYENLGNAVILQAVNDLRTVIREAKGKITPEESIEFKELYEFFHSDEFSYFTDLDGKTLYNKIIAEEVEKLYSERKKYYGKKQIL